MLTILLWVVLTPLILYLIGMVLLVCLVEFLRAMTG